MVGFPAEGGMDAGFLLDRAVCERDTGQVLDAAACSSAQLAHFASLFSFLQDL